MKRVVFYIDGFNLYYGLKTKKWKNFYWLDLVKFCSCFLKKDQILETVNYFTAFPKNYGKKKRQDIFISANKLNSQFILHTGKFLEKQITCPHCLKQINSFEEKQTDVNLAIQVINDVIFNKTDITVIISADSDLVSAVNFIRQYNPMHPVFFYFPPNRYSSELKQKANNVIILEKHPDSFQKSLLPESLTLPNGHILNCPVNWK